jgi:DNA helicase-2/ATP-dependent DNA helicase PcrA
MGQTTLFCLPREEKVELFEELETEAFPPAKIEIPLDHHKFPFTDPILDPLNPEQKDAVRHRGSHLLIVAGPGTGKTMTLAHRMAYLIHSEQASPGQILALTFTNKAAREMGERITTLVQKESASEVWVSTFHGFCLEVLRSDGEKINLPSPFTVCSELDASALAQQVISESGKGKRTASKFLRRLPHLKMASVMGNGSDLRGNDFSSYFRSYQQRLRKLGMLDLDDLEVETLRLFQQDPKVCHEWAERFSKIFVDEYQDTNPTQVAILKSLIQADSGEICAIGDPDQSIYGFRGADVENFHRFAEDFPGARKIQLSKNYRSSQIILDCSSALMEKDNPLKGIVEGGHPIRFASCGTQAEEAEMIVEQIEKLLGGTTYFSLDSGRVASHENGEDLSFGDIAVLFRLNAQGDAFQEAFKRAGIPFIRSGERPLIKRYPVNIVWRCLQALQYPDNNYYLKAYLELPDMAGLNGQEILSQFEDKGSIADLIDQAVTLHNFDCSSEESVEALRRVKEIAENFGVDTQSFLDALSLERGIDHVNLLGDRVALLSLHAAKGLQWPVVFITGCEDGLIPCSLFGARDEAEEKRLFYVGMTRARSKLILSHAGRRTINGRALHLDKSPFLHLIPQELCLPLERAAWKRKEKTHKQLGLFK